MLKIAQKIIIVILILSIHTLASSNLIKKRLIDKFQETYQSITIDNIKVIPLGSNKNNLNNFKIKAIYISKASLKKSRGTFSVLYSNGNIEKKRFFKYIINAKIGVYRAVRNIKKNSPILKSDLSYEDLQFNQIRFSPITSKYINRYCAKRNISENEIISTKDIKIIPDIKRGQMIDATLYSDGIFVNFSVISMQNGVIGDLIRVKNSKKKNFKAKIVSTTAVEILD